MLPARNMSEVTARRHSTAASSTRVEGSNWRFEGEAVSEEFVGGDFDRRGEGDREVAVRFVEVREEVGGIGRAELLTRGRA